jgi:FAD:protein FMN transferase
VIASKTFLNVTFAPEVNVLRVGLHANLLNYKQPCLINLERNMKPLYPIAIAFLAIGAAFASLTTHSKNVPWRTSHYENVLGTSMEIKLVATSDAAAEKAEAAAMGEIKRLNGILSGYDPTSEFSRWTATRNEAVRIAPELMEVLKLWDRWRERSGGALNPAAEAISRVWKRSQAAGAMPTDLEMAAAARLAGGSHWQLDERSGLATHLTATPLILNSFTKSYVIDRAATAALMTPGVTGIVLNIGGDLVLRGSQSDRVSVTDPRSDEENSDPVAVLDIGNRAVATSGNYRRGFDIGGTHYSHVVDPRTGRTAEGIIGATVVAQNAVDAGALATAFCVLSPEESQKLAGTVPGAEYMLMDKNGTRFASAGWNALQATPVQLVAQAVPPSKATASSSDTSWNTGFELTINVEIPQIQGFGARQPYVAVWIEDKDRFPVRTLAVWLKKTRWLNELRAWYRDDRMRATSEGNEILGSVTSATRSPGKYTFKWDGKDNSGKLVKAGRYTVLIEAAREHGGYTLDRHEMNFNGEPSQAQLPPDAELGAVSLEYHKVAR